MEQKIQENLEKRELLTVCAQVKELVCRGKYEECNSLLRSTIGIYPHASEPYNLYGIMYEKQGKHMEAVKHFRAAWALDPTYLPARYNLDQCGSFYGKKEVAYEEADCPNFEQEDLYETKYNEKGIGQIVRKQKVKENKKDNLMGVSVWGLTNRQIKEVENYTRFGLKIS